MTASSKASKNGDGGENKPEKARTATPCTSPHLGNVPFLHVKGVGVEGAQDLHGLIVARLGLQHLLKTLGRLEVKAKSSHLLHLATVKLLTLAALGHSETCKKWSCHKYNFCRNKRMLVATRFVTTNICCGKHTFVATKDAFCHDKNDTCGSSRQ